MRLRLTLRQLEYLVAVGETGSIALAAARLNVSSPSISAAITALEQEFGLQLFVRRHARGLTLTTGGAQLVAEATKVLAGAEGLSELARAITGEIRGPLTVGCLITFAQVVLPQLRRSFVDLHPEVALQQFEGDQLALFEGLRDARIDVALGYDLAIPAGLEFEPLARLPPYAVLHDASPLAGRTEVSPHDLAQYPMILLDLPLSVDYFLSVFSAVGATPLIGERTRDMGVMQSLVGQGFGYGIANIRPWSDRSPDGQKLRFIPLVATVRPMNLGLILACGARASMTTRAFVAHCRDQLTSERFPGLRPDLGQT